MKQKPVDSRSRRWIQDSRLKTQVARPKFETSSLGPRVSRIGVIGAGKMGQALIKGFIARGIPAPSILAADASQAIRRDVARRFHVRVTKDNRAAARGADVVILAVKPQQFPEVVPSLSAVLRSHQLVVSIAAGITLRWLRARLPRAALVRVMPNLPATVGCGFSAIAVGPRVTARQRQIAIALFEAVGVTCELPESSFDAVTAVSGSGPAYVFFLVEAWQQAARALGLSDGVAAEAIAKTLEGSLRLLQETQEPASVLMAKVASKKGTTEAALRILKQRQVRAAFIRALQAAARRSHQLAWT